MFNLLDGAKDLVLGLPFGLYGTFVVEQEARLQQADAGPLPHGPAEVGQPRTMQPHTLCLLCGYKDALPGPAFFILWPPQWKAEL